VTLAVTGLTSNPTIIGHAMAAGSDYDRSLARLAGDGVTDAQDLVYALALEDLAEAAALFGPDRVFRTRYPMQSGQLARARNRQGGSDFLPEQWKRLHTSADRVERTVRKYAWLCIKRAPG
jgi:Transaldolase/Fructose-6-phosphate aldolase